MILRPSTTALVLAVACIFSAGAPAAHADYEVKRKSHFDQSSVPRNIFWPIGYVHQPDRPARTQAAPKVVAPKLTAAQFVVSSILIGGGLPLAVINGQDRAVGDPLVVNGVTVEVGAILDGVVILRHEGQEISVPLKQ